MYMERRETNEAYLQQAVTEEKDEAGVKDTCTDHDNNTCCTLYCIYDHTDCTIRLCDAGTSKRYENRKPQKKGHRKPALNAAFCALSFLFSRFIKSLKAASSKLF